MGQIYGVLKTAVGVWFAFSALAFLSGPAAAFLETPRWLGLPWSDVGDFTVGTDGDVYVGLDFYGQVLRYDADGSFVASYPLLKRKGTEHLATGADGRIYTRFGRRVDVHDADWNHQGKTGHNPGDPRSWMLGDDGELVHAPDAPGDRVDAPVRPGQIMFADGESPRVFFAAADHVYIRHGSTITKKATDGRVVATYAPPWHLRVLAFPFPAALSWLAGLLLIASEQTVERFRRKKP